MSRLSQKLVRYGGVKLSRRLKRSVPIVGTLIAVATVGATIRRKGVISGTLDTGLNAMPLVGALKNAVEILRGRDFFPDRFPEAPYPTLGPRGGSPVDRKITRP